MIATSIISKMEFSAALHRKYRENSIGLGPYRKAMDQFARESEAGRLAFLSLSSQIIDDITACYWDLPATVFLRTGDAIHLGTAREAGLKETYSNDRHLLAAAPRFKLKGINPLAK